MPSYKARNGAEIAAVRGVVRSMLSMLEGGATHLGVATGAANLIGGSAVLE